jgi:hypothetical protein
MDLYAAYLGGPLADGRMGEGHEVVLVAAADRADAGTRAVAKWRGTPPGHLDALERIVRVDGFDVTLTASSGGGASTGDDLEMETFN